ncbi:MAG: Na+/H+ antiporter NhaA [Pseudomonadota bacterium]
MPRNALRDFLKLESSAGILLVLAAIAALLASNSPAAGLYQRVFDVPLAVSLGDLSIAKPMLLWINDGLMAIFFLLIGLEVKREVLEGQLRSKEQVLLPAVAGLGGFVVPAAIYAALNWGNAETINGWAIPAATDIAFALGVLSVLGSRVPLALKVFLTTIAIFDDIAAILVIAVFYTADLSVLSLVLAGIGSLVLLGLNRWGITSTAAYLLVGTFVWMCVLKSGVHATLAGIVVALAIPLTAPDGQHSPLKDLEHRLHPWVAFAILPLFAFANAGVELGGIETSVLFGPVSLGIALGLFVGKQLGVFGTVWVIVKLGLARLPEGANWLSVYGVSILTGIGFTMSFFIGSLAFERGDLAGLAATRVGVLIGSILSAVVGYVILRAALSARPQTRVAASGVAE